MLASLGLLSSSGWAAGKARKLNVHSVKGTDYVLLKDIADFYGFPGIDIGDRLITLKSQWTTLEFMRGSRLGSINDIRIWMQSGTRQIEPGWAIAQADLQHTIDPILRPHAHLHARGSRVVVLDPGHGGDDSGALSIFGLQERNLALDIARKVKKRLVTQGYKVYLTRDADDTLEKEKRIEQTKKWKADLFVSIHLNSAGSGSANGFETYALTSPGFPSTNDPDQARVKPTEHPGNRFNPANMLLAYSIQRNLVNGGKQSDRGLRRARFQVLKNAVCPAALVECGFLSNRKEESMMRSEKHLDDLASGIFLGIQGYLAQVTRARLLEKTKVPGKNQGKKESSDAAPKAEPGAAAATEVFGSVE